MSEERGPQKTRDFQQPKSEGGSYQGQAGSDGSATSTTTNTMMTKPLYPQPLVSFQQPARVPETAEGIRLPI